MSKWATWDMVCENERHVVTARWFEDRRGFCRYLRSKYKTHNVPIGGKGKAAVMLGFYPEQVAAGDPNAELVFYREQFTADSIAHEVGHALFWFYTMPEKRIDEENFCRLLGILTQAIIEWRDAEGLGPV